MQDSKKIKIIDNISKEVLHEDDYENMDFVYKKAAEYEAMGLDIKIVSPSVSETLIVSLGANEEDVQNLRQSELEELESHNTPTCDSGIEKSDKLH